MNEAKNTKHTKRTVDELKHEIDSVAYDRAKIARSNKYYRHSHSDESWLGTLNSFASPLHKNIDKAQTNKFLFNAEYGARQEIYREMALNCKYHIGVVLAAIFGFIMFFVPTLSSYFMDADEITSLSEHLFITLAIILLIIHLVISYTSKKLESAFCNYVRVDPHVFYDYDFSNKYDMINDIACTLEDNNDIQTAKIIRKYCSDFEPLSILVSIVLCSAVGWVVGFVSIPVVTAITKYAPTLFKEIIESFQEFFTNVVTVFKSLLENVAYTVTTLPWVAIILTCIVLALVCVISLNIKLKKRYKDSDR